MPHQSTFLIEEKSWYVVVYTALNVVGLQTLYFQVSKSFRHRIFKKLHSGPKDRKCLQKITISQRDLLNTIIFYLGSMNMTDHSQILNMWHRAKHMNQTYFQSPEGKLRNPSKLHQQKRPTKLQMIRPAPTKLQQMLVRETKHT